MDVLTAIRTRRSIRKFAPKVVEKAKIETILEAGFCAPTAYKYVCDFFTIRKKIIPMAVIAVGYPAEEKDSPQRYDEAKVHWETW